MIKRTYSRCKLSGHLPNNIVVATESKKIIKFCKKNSMNSIFTSSKCLTGTDRVAEVAKRLNYKYYINLQGDEPIFNPEDIKNLINEVKKNPESIVNGYCQIKNNSQYLSINTPKVVISKKTYLMYISRAPDLLQLRLLVARTTSTGRTRQRRPKTVRRTATDRSSMQYPTTEFCG